jgi:cysteinyl-tRNA synthetase
MELLVERGFAYAPGNGDLYLEVRKLPSYLTLSNQKLDDLLPAADADEKYKKDPRDFALWKSAKPNDPSWPTPWGPGRPGWHLECSAMAHQYLGDEFDIHGGGMDLIFPHHENEIAQSEAAGYKFARLWMHNAWVTTAGEKMSKSLGNSLIVSEILKKYRGIELRWYLGSAHYRSMLEFSFGALDESVTNFRRIESFLQKISKSGEIEKNIDSEFKVAMDNDLAVPEALALISKWLRAGNTALTQDQIDNAREFGSKIRGALDILGCDPFDPAFSESGDRVDQSAGIEKALDGLISFLLSERDEARSRKDFQSADRIRDRIAELGILIEDTNQGTRWSVK